MSRSKDKTHPNRREYVSWLSMRQRCNNPNHHSFANYAGRGISICLAWDSFDAFLRDMGKRPQGASLDRINNDLGYEPGNCRWADAVSQNRNRRFNRNLTINGITKCASEWQKESPVSIFAINERLEKGWSPEMAVFTPAMSVNGHSSVNRQPDNVREFRIFNGGQAA